MRDRYRQRFKDPSKKILFAWPETDRQNHLARRVARALFGDQPGYEVHYRDGLWQLDSHNDWMLIFDNGEVALSCRYHLDDEKARATTMFIHYYIMNVAECDNGQLDTTTARE